MHWDGTDGARRWDSRRWTDLTAQGLFDMSKQRLGQAGARGRLDRLGAYGRELSNHLVEAWFLATTKARTRLLKRVRALLDLSRRR